MGVSFPAVQDVDQGPGALDDQRWCRRQGSNLAGAEESLGWGGRAVEWIWKTTMLGAELEDDDTMVVEISTGVAM